MNPNEYDGREKAISEIGTDARKAMKPNVWMYGEAARISIVVLICLGIGWGLVSLYL